METLSFDRWVLDWAVTARQVPRGAVVAGLLVDLAADPRTVHADPMAVFPLIPAARALGVSPATIHTALHRLAEAGLISLRVEDHPSGSHMVATLLHPGGAGIPSDR
ncbi:hypothetical protein [Streptomyces lydicus]|uniref:hypothetical protein n=1 Tax=Streptomyces lydicus TaxID=47763 RepID=UPI0010139BAA|nr:hypothetical protein [Streptomyces lydicus]MCZ1009422.1 hypothetical protein [Streptomyces lydicus]